MATTTESSDQASGPQIDIDKMLRFSQWLFAEPSQTESRHESPPDGNAPDEQRAA